MTQDQLSSRIAPEEFVPGGIAPTDHVHVGTNDASCSRCRRQPPEDDMPLQLWHRGGEDLLIYCGRCLDPPPAGAATCRVCGCWELAACYDEELGPCWWVEQDLCSHCQEKRQKSNAKTVRLSPGFGG